MYPLNMKLIVGSGFAVANNEAEHKSLTDAGYGPAYGAEADRARRAAELVASAPIPVTHPPVVSPPPRPEPVHGHTPVQPPAVVLPAHTSAHLSPPVPATRQHLLEQANAMGIKVDLRWSDARLAEVIADNA